MILLITCFIKYLIVNNFYYNLACSTQGPEIFEATWSEIKMR